VSGVTAPVAPGRLGRPLDPAQVQTYLAELEEWLRGRRTELDELDAAIEAILIGATVGRVLVRVAA